MLFWRYAEAPTFGPDPQVRGEMRAERAFLNCSELDRETTDIHEWPARRQAFALGRRDCGGPERIPCAAKGFLSGTLVCADPRVLRSMSMMEQCARQSPVPGIVKEELLEGGRAVGARRDPVRNSQPIDRCANRQIGVVDHDPTRFRRADDCVIGPSSTPPI